ncbi:MAG: coniferyl-alcohol dehydrogenase [Acidimicrobiales bacterium]
MGVERFRYDGRRVVVTGAASGMGEATARALVELGAEVHGLDVNQVPLEGIARSVQVDLRDPFSIESALEAVGGPIHALFSVAGLPGPPFSDIDTMKVNFIGARHLVETAIERELMPPGSAVACVSSFAGMGWEQNMGTLAELLRTEHFDDAVKWCEEHQFVGYAPSKQALNAYTAWRNVELLKHGVRLNTIGPGVTDTAMSPHFVSQMGQEFMDSFPKPMGRTSHAEEQAYPLVFLNSDAASYLSGVVMYTDGGLYGGLVTGAVSFG